MASLTWKSINSAIDGLIVAITNRHFAVPHKLCAVQLIYYLQSVSLGDTVTVSLAVRAWIKGAIDGRVLYPNCETLIVSF